MTRAEVRGQRAGWTYGPYHVGGDVGGGGHHPRTHARGQACPLQFAQLEEGLHIGEGNRQVDRDPCSKCLVQIAGNATRSEVN